MKIVTCISDRNNYGFSSLLLRSCEHFGLELITLVHNGPWRSHRLKDFHLRSYLHRIPADEIILYTDGYDTALVRDEADILAMYSTFATPVVFSAEKNCWPDRDLADRYPVSSAQFPYLNSGGFIGPAGLLASLMSVTDSLLLLYGSLRLNHFYRTLRRTLHDIKQNREFAWSNQYYWTKVFMAHQQLVSLDYHAKLFLTLSNGLSVEEQTQYAVSGKYAPIYHQETLRLQSQCTKRDGRFLCLPANSAPAHIHFNGPVMKQIAYDGHLDDLMPWR